MRCTITSAPPNFIETHPMNEQLTTDQIRELALAALDDLKAKDVEVMDVRTLTSITDYMIVASGASNRHVKALADSVVEKSKQAGHRPLSVEGEREAEWILVDLADVARAVAEEGERMLAAIPKDSLVIALEVDGKSWSTEMLAREFAAWLQDGRDVALLVGGPDGLADSCRARADMKWSLSPLTLPHMLVRIVAAEQLYRAWSVLQGHPYHRA